MVVYLKVQDILGKFYIFVPIFAFVAYLKILLYFNVAEEFGVENNNIVFNTCGVHYEKHEFEDEFTKARKWMIMHDTEFKRELISVTNRHGEQVFI